METLTNSDNVTYYAVMVNGQIVGPKVLTPQAAEAQMMLLDEAHRSIAEVVPITENGQQILFG